MFYNSSHIDGELRSFDFLKKNHHSANAKARSNPKGVAKKNKEQNVIEKLVPLRPPDVLSRSSMLQ